MMCSIADFPDESQSATASVIVSGQQRLLGGQQELAIEQGSVTVLIAAIAGAMLLLSAAVIGAVSLHGVQVKVQAVADLAALAAASQVPSALVMDSSEEGSVSCGIAQQVIERNSFQIDSCWKDDGDIRLIVAKPVQWIGVGGTITGRARAGPT